MLIFDTMDALQQPGNTSKLSAAALVPRGDGRTWNQLRTLTFENHIAPQALGSTLIKWGNTHVICAVTIEETVPRWMKEQGVSGGWVTAEYSMLPYSTSQRKTREVSRGKVEGRTQEIQRLIGRAMRAAVDAQKLGARTLWIDCDVLQADGGTRTASITGSFVALGLALKKLLASGKLPDNPLLRAVAAVSVGILHGQVILDLNYAEDSTAEVDMNIAMAANGEFIEMQGTGEKSGFNQSQLDQMMALGREALIQLFAKQEQAIQDCP
jgi:ribonuclease PH